MSSYSLTHSLSFASDHSNPKLIIPHNPKVPGVNLWLITTTRPHLIQVICLSLHPVRETLQSLLLLRPALCPLFNPVERPGSGGSKLISSGVRTDNAFVAVANVKLLLSMCGWVSAAGTTTNAIQAFVQMLFLLINRVLCLLILLIYHQNI